MKTIGKFIERPADALVWLACVAAVVMMLHIVIDVFSKYAFNAPLEGTIEIVAGYYMVAVVFFPFAYVAYREGHIIVELFTRNLAPRKVRMLDGVIAIFTFAYLAVFTWQTLEEAIYRTVQLEIWETGTFMIAIWPSRWLLPIGGGLMAVYVLYRLVRDLGGRDDY